MSRFKSHLIWLSLLTIITLLVTRHIWSTRGWIESHDGIFHVIRLEEFTQMFKLGHFPVRWAGNLDNGFGLPLFNYVYPGPYYLGLPLTYFGLSAKWAVKLLFIAFYWLGGVGVYTALASRSRPIAFTASVLFLTAPYLLLNLFVRGALGELAAICLIPWVVVAWQDLSKRGLSWYHPLAYFLLFLTHNFLSFLFLPFYLLLLLSNKVSRKASVASLALSLGLASFFVLPMFLESQLVTSASAGNYTYNYADHFLEPSQFITGNWGYGHSVLGLGDGLSFTLGFAYLALIALSFLVYPRALLPLVAVLFFTTSASHWLWELIRPLEIVQFPWRFLALAVVLLPYLVSQVLPKLHKYALVTGILLLGVSLWSMWTYSTPPYFMNNEQFAKELYIHRTKTTTSSRLELLPRWTDQVERWRGSEDFRIVGGQANVSLATSSPLAVEILVDNQDPSTTLLVRRNFFPSWQAVTGEGKSVSLAPSELGEIQLTAPLGLTKLRVYVGSTAVESIANLFSVLTALVVLALAVKPRLKQILDTRYAGWDISIALRYLPIVKDLQKKLSPKDKILEVGSEITGITPYLKRRVTGLDQGFDYSRQNEYLTPVVGSAVKMPFKNRSFDYTLSVDVVEHIPPQLRAPAIREMLRVTKKRVYLTFPCGHRSELIDRELDEYFYRQNGYHFDYLSEHVDHGLPQSTFIPDLLRSFPQWRLTRVLGNTSSWLWVFLLKLGLSNIPWKTSLYRRLLFFTPLLHHINFGHTYRLLYIIDRTPVMSKVEL